MQAMIAAFDTISAGLPKGLPRYGQIFLADAVTRTKLAPDEALFAQACKDGRKDEQLLLRGI